MNHTSKRKNTIIPFLLLLLLGLWARPTEAQTQAETIETMSVDIWPDYDQPAVLVLLTGTLTPNTSLPAEVTIPLPDEASVNAVARIDSSNTMIDDIEFDNNQPGQLTLTTPDSRFRVEYYVPYTAAGAERQLSFDWLADITVNQLLLSVQVPVSASGLTVDPTAATVTTGQDGLQYHHLPATIIPAGQQYTMQANYTMTEDTLSVAALPPPQQAAPATTGGESEGTTETAVTDPNSDILPLYLAIGGGLLVGLAGIWWYMNTRTSQRVHKPRPKRTQRTPARPQPKRRPTPQPEPPEPQAASGAVQFCHECGQPVDGNDRFCRQCGTAVKGRV